MEITGEQSSDRGGGIEASAPGPPGGSPTGAGADGGRGDGGEVPSDRLEQIIRRATELQHGREDERRDFLSEEEIVRIGGEVGLEPAHVRRALAEWRARSLLPDSPEDGGPLRRIGDAIIRSSRAVPGDPTGVQRKVESHFRLQESLQAVRTQPGRSLWEPSEGLLSKMQRSLDVGGRGYELAEAANVELAITGLEEGWSLVTLTADARNVRSRYAVSWLAGSAPFFAAGAVMMDLLAGVPLLLGGPLAAGGALATAAAGAGRSLDQRRRRIRLVMEGLLDRLEQGLSLEPDRPGWRDRILR